MAGDHSHNVRNILVFFTHQCQSIDIFQQIFDFTGLPCVSTLVVGYLEVSALCKQLCKRDTFRFRGKWAKFPLGPSGRTGQQVLNASR